MSIRSTQESFIDLSQSQPSSSKAAKSSGKKHPEGDSQVTLGHGEFKRKVSEMVRYILLADRKKVGIKRPDIVKNVLKDQPRLFNKVFQEACQQMKETFGFDVVHMETEDGKSRGYTLINALDEDVFCGEDEFLEWEDESQQMSLLLIILSIIFMNNCPVTDANLWYALKKVGIQKDSEHQLFGNVEKMINTEFVKKHYLKIQKIPLPEGFTLQYSFGARSLKEISKRKILEFVSDVYGFDDISKWKIQYQNMLKEETGEED